MGTTTGTRVLCTQYLLRVANNVFLKEEGQQRKRQRQATIPPVAMSFEVLNGKWQGKMRVTVC